MTLVLLAASAMLIPLQNDPFARWEKAIRKHEAKDRRQSPPREGILFVGSSSIVKWDLKKWFPDLPVINRGFGGSQIVDSTHFADRLILPHRPRTVVLYAGDNDIGRGKDADRVVRDYRAFVKKVHEALPKTRILFIAIKPSIKRIKLDGEMTRANTLIREQAAKTEHLEFVDIAAPMRKPDGKPRPELFVKDGLHLSEEGYRLWTSVLRPYLDGKK